MALSILCRGGHNILHLPAHDLESLFYILLHICTSLVGPHKQMRRPKKKGDRSIPMLGWFNHMSSYDRLGRDKHGQLAAFEHNILNHFTPYFDPLKPLADNLFRAIFPNGVLGFAPEPKITHTQMKYILRSAIHALSKPGIHAIPSLVIKTRTRHHVSQQVEHSHVASGKKRSASRAQLSEEETNDQTPQTPSETVDRTLSSSLSSPYISREGSTASERGSTRGRTRSKRRRSHK